MNKQDKDKAIEISGHYLQIVDCFAKTHYDEDDILSTARDAAIEMAAWKEQQMVEKAVEYINNTIGQGGWLNSCQIDNFIEDFKKYMEN